ncbi:MAG TPA: hypothetical protein V6D33_12390 [Cyanophyceae cyanobacterium]
MKRDDVKPVPGSVVRSIPAVEGADTFLMKVEVVDNKKERCYGHQIDAEGNLTGDYRARSFQNCEVIDE